MSDNTSKLSKEEQHEVFKILSEKLFKIRIKKML